MHYIIIGVPVAPTGRIEYSFKVNPFSSACALIFLLNMSLPVSKINKTKHPNNNNNKQIIINKVV